MLRIRPLNTLVARSTSQENRRQLAVAPKYCCCCFEFFRDICCAILKRSLSREKTSRRSRKRAKKILQLKKKVNISPSCTRWIQVKSFCSHSSAFTLDIPTVSAVPESTSSYAVSDGIAEPPQSAEVAKTSSEERPVTQPATNSLAAKPESEQKPSPEPSSSFPPATSLEVPQPAENGTPLSAANGSTPNGSAQKPTEAVRLRLLSSGLTGVLLSTSSEAGRSKQGQRGQRARSFVPCGSREKGKAESQQTPAKGVPSVRRLLPLFCLLSQNVFCDVSVVFSLSNDPWYGILPHNRGDAADYSRAVRSTPSLKFWTKAWINGFGRQCDFETKSFTSNLTHNGYT